MKDSMEMTFGECSQGMTSTQEIVVTGLGVVSPIGIGAAPFWASLREGRSGIGRLSWESGSLRPQPFGGAVADFDPKQYVRPRKSLKVMSREIQLGFAAADMACSAAGVGPGAQDPERLGVVLGADIIPCELSELIGTYRDCLVDGRFDFSRWGKAFANELFPLWMLKYLPNMPACHIGIAQDARGPNNTLTLGDVSTLGAISEAARTIDRGQADVMIAGGTGSRIHAALYARNQIFGQSQRDGDPAAASRPFDADRDGVVQGEGAGALILESRRHADARGVAPLARLLGFAGAFEPRADGQPLRGDAIRRALATALKNAGRTPEQVGCVVAHGTSAVHGDRIESQAIHEVLGDVPVTAPKSFFGYLSAASGALESVLAVLTLQQGAIPPTLNYATPDPQCPIRVVHGGVDPLERPVVLVLSYSLHGQAVALAFGRPEAD
ncbi:MAG: beta-ketoacyl-[acyl-carrier-protein] synthase family protein [Thermoguttaceae bacterium]